jgi:hypothetical protein
MSPKNSGVVLGLVALAAAPLMVSAAHAQTDASATTPQNVQLIQKLRGAREIAKENEGSWTQEPITSREFADQESQINRLIRRLKRGEHVSPSQINDALKSPDTPY